MLKHDTFQVDQSAGKTMVQTPSIDDLLWFTSEKKHLVMLHDVPSSWRRPLEKSPLAPDWDPIMHRCKAKHGRVICKWRQIKINFSNYVIVYIYIYPCIYIYIDNIWHILMSNLIWGKEISKNNASPAIRHATWMAQGAAKRFQSSGVKQCAQDLSAADVKNRGSDGIIGL